jgi:hypothetical protein
VLAALGSRFGERGAHEARAEKSRGGHRRKDAPRRGPVASRKRK